MTLRCLIHALSSVLPLVQPRQDHLNARAPSFAHFRREAGLDDLDGRSPERLGQQPFDGEDKEEVERSILNGDLIFPSSEFEGVS